MQNRVNVITLGVDDLERSLRFYRDGLGLASDGIIGTEFEGSNTEPSGRVAMFGLDDGLILSVFARADLAKDAHLSVTELAGSGFSLGHTVQTRDEVDALLAAAAAAGGTVTAPAHERPWGIYSGYFADPDGHLWEVVYFVEGGDAGQ